MYSWRICCSGDVLLGFCLRSWVRLDVSSFYLVQGGWYGVWVAWFLQFVLAVLFLNCAWVSCCCACSLVVLVQIQILALFALQIARAFSCDVFGTAVCVDSNIVFCFCGGLFTSLLCSTSHFLRRAPYDVKRLWALERSLLELKMLKANCNSQNVKIRTHVSDLDPA